MQLEQNLEMYRQMQRTVPKRQVVYTIVDLEYLSANALYTPKPGDDFGGLPMFSLGDAQLDFGSGQPRIISGKRGIKIQSEEGSIPLVRLDFPAMHGLPKNHLQFGEGTYTGRHGNEAADLIAQIIVNNARLKFPGMDDDDEKK